MRQILKIHFTVFPFYIHDSSYWKQQQLNITFHFFFCEAEIGSGVMVVESDGDDRCVMMTEC